MTMYTIQTPTADTDIEMTEIHDTDNGRNVSPNQINMATIEMVRMMAVTSTCG